MNTENIYKQQRTRNTRQKKRRREWRRSKSEHLHSHDIILFIFQYQKLEYCVKATCTRHVLCVAISCFTKSTRRLLGTPVSQLPHVEIKCVSFSAIFCCTQCIEAAFLRAGRRISRKLKWSGEWKAHIFAAAKTHTHANYFRLPGVPRHIWCHSKFSVFKID